MSASSARASSPQKTRAEQLLNRLQVSNAAVQGKVKQELGYSLSPAKEAGNQPFNRTLADYSRSRARSLSVEPPGPSRGAPVPPQDHSGTPMERIARLDNIIAAPWTGGAASGEDLSTHDVLEKLDAGLEMINEEVVVSPPHVSACAVTEPATTEPATTEPADDASPLKSALLKTDLFQESEGGASAEETGELPAAAADDASPLKNALLKTDLFSEDAQPPPPPPGDPPSAVPAHVLPEEVRRANQQALAKMGGTTEPASELADSKPTTVGGQEADSRGDGPCGKEVLNLEMESLTQKLREAGEALAAQREATEFYKNQHQLALAEVQSLKAQLCADPASSASRQEIRKLLIQARDDIVELTREKTAAEEALRAYQVQATAPQARPMAARAVNLPDVPISPDGESSKVPEPRHPLPSAVDGSRGVKPCLVDSSPSLYSSTKVPAAVASYAWSSSPPSAAPPAPALATPAPAPPPAPAPAPAPPPAPAPADTPSSSEQPAAPTAAAPPPADISVPGDEPLTSQRARFSIEALKRWLDNVLGDLANLENLAGVANSADAKQNFQRIGKELDQAHECVVELGGKTEPLTSDPSRWSLSAELADVFIEVQQGLSRHKMLGTRAKLY